MLANPMFGGCNHQLVIAVPGGPLLTTLKYKNVTLPPHTLDCQARHHDHETYQSSNFYTPHPLTPPSHTHPPHSHHIYPHTPLNLTHAHTAHSLTSPSPSHPLSHPHSLTSSLSIHTDQDETTVCERLKQDFHSTKAALRQRASHTD